MSLFCVWSNCRYLEPCSGVITGDPFFIIILERVTAEIQRQTTFRLGTPRASSSGCSAPLLLSPSSLHLLWARYTHTHTHTQIQPTQAHACIHTCLAWGHKCKQGTQVFQELKTALSSNVGDGVNRHHVLPLGLPVHLLPKLLRIFPRKPEATSSAACVVVVVTSEW